MMMLSEEAIDDWTPFADSSTTTDKEDMKFEEKRKITLDSEEWLTIEEIKDKIGTRGIN